MMFCSFQPVHLETLLYTGDLQQPSSARNILANDSNDSNNSNDEPGYKLHGLGLVD